MEISPSPITPPPSAPPLPSASGKKGMGTGAKIGIGCGSIILLLIIAAVIASVIFGGKLKNFAEEAQKNPTRATATTMEKVSGGKLQIIAQDDVLKRYTLKDPSGTLTTVYWDDVKKAPVTISGDFSAIPATAIPAPAPAPAPGN